MLSCLLLLTLVPINRILNLIAHFFNLGSYFAKISKPRQLDYYLFFHYYTASS